MTMSPGTYLMKRRKAASMSLKDVARRLVNLPWAIGPAGDYEVERLTMRLRAAEHDELPITQEQAELVCNAYALSPQVYQLLLDLRLAGGDQSGLPIPAVCECCGCSWNDPCHIPSPAMGTRRVHTDRGPAVLLFTEACAWTSPEQSLCTACDRHLGAVAAPDAQPLGEAA